MDGGYPKCPSCGRSMDLSEYCSFGRCILCLQKELKESRDKPQTACLCGSGREQKHCCG